MINKFTNNLPGYGYANVRLKPKIYTSYTGLFTGSSLYPTASYGLVPTKLKFNNLPSDKINKAPIKSCSYKISLSKVIINLINKTTLTLTFNNIHIDNLLNSDIITSGLNVSLPIRITFYLYNYYQGVLVTLDLKNKNLQINNIRPLNNDPMFYGNLNQYLLFNHFNLYVCLP